MLGHYGASAAFKPHQTRRKKTNVVYRCSCQDCYKVFIGETKKLCDRIIQHTADTVSNQSTIHEHYKLTGHNLDKDSVTLLSREENTLPRKVREAIYIKERLTPP